MSPEESVPEAETAVIDLKNRWLALFLAWLFPGMGYLYQGRIFKGILVAVCLIPLLVGGVWMGTYREVSADGTPGTLRVASCVYCSFPQKTGSVPNNPLRTFLSGRLYFIPQAANAVMAVPALIQSHRVNKGQAPLWQGAFASPRQPGEIGDRPTLNETLLTLHSWYDLGTIYVAVAGLLNILILFDVFAGPAWNRPKAADGQ